jgi:SNF2 family DNA or RNA helicase
MHSNSHQFCFDLLFKDKLKSFLPVSYIVNHSDTITYIEKRATTEIIKNYGVDIEKLDDKTKKLLNICDVLKLEMIFKKFAKNIKSAKTIDDLLKDSKIAFGINQFVNINLKEFLQITSENNLPLSLNLGNKKDFYNYKITTENIVLKPKLYFDKTENGITYALFLQENEMIFQPSNHQIDLIFDEPCWIVFDKKLCQVEAINSKKLLPFLNKKSIEIPTKIIPEFFEKFIKDIVKKVDIEATGFEVIQKNEIKTCHISFEHDFFKKKYYLNLIFDYDGYLFDNLKAKKTHSEIDLTDLENIKVVQFKRNKNEILFENKLLENGFVKTENGLFKQINESKSDVYENVQWLIDNKNQIENLGYTIDNLKLEGKKLITQIATIQQTNDLKNDWFDVKMIVVCGDFQFNFTDIIAKIKYENRIYNLPDGSVFLIPMAWFTTYAALVKLAKNENGILKLPKSNFAVLENSDSNVVINNNSKIDYEPSNLLKATLRPYQIEGVKWLLEHYNNRLGACLADDMGLGKTLQTLAVLVAVQEQLEYKAVENQQMDLFGNEIVQPKEFLKTLIVLPSSLVFNWNNEARKFTPHLHKIQYIGNDRKLLAKKLDRYDLIFTSYSIISRDISVFEKYNFRYLILDESHYIKNKNSKVFKAISQIQSENKISLSGTPIENSFDDLWSQMQFINPNILGSFKFFNENYKIPIQKKQDENALAELKSIINPFILRRTKDQVLKDLPELTEQVFYCDMEPEQEKLYEEEKSKARNYLLNNDQDSISKINIINSLMRLRQLSNHPKMIDKTSEMDSGKYIAVTNYLENLVQSNQKTIVFSSFVTNLEFYKNWCESNEIEYCELTGSTNLKDREIAVNRFQNQVKPLLFFISLKAGGVGLNITKASFVLFLDPWWNPFAEKQGISRAHRIGQENKVSVVRFITKNTVEEKILLLQENKKLLSDSLLDESFISPEIEANLDYILE